MPEIFDFTALGRALLDWPVGTEALDLPAATPLLGRLRQILQEARSRGAPAHAPDLMVLVRQLLIERSSGGPVDEHLSVPRGRGWPDADMWRRFECGMTETAERLLIAAHPWRPDWLGALPDGSEDIFSAEHQARLVRADARVAMDPFVREVTGFKHYVCPGQKEALLSALLMPAGTSLIVNLPTGSGKSLVAQAPMLVHGLDAGLTLFIVPTNALALDLERRTRELLMTRDPAPEPHPLEIGRASCRERVYTKV